MRSKAYMSQINPQSTYMKYLNDKRSFGNSRYSDSRLDRPTARVIRHPGSCRPWRFCSTGRVGPICCARHGRPRHSAAEATDKLWHWRYCPQVVPVVPDQPYPLCPSWYGPIDHCSADMWCWANFGHHVYSWPGFTHLAALHVAALLRWWHSDLWCKWSIWFRRPAAEDYRMSDSCCRLDVGQSAPTEFR